MLAGMGFLDKAKAAATDLAAKADTALNQAQASFSGGDAERLLRDYGLLTWREQQGQTVDTTELARVREALQSMEQGGRLRDLQLHTTPAPPPPPPGGYQAPPPPGGTSTPPPPPGSSATPPPSSPLQPGGGSSPHQPGGGTTPPPPPPPPPGF